MIENCELCGEPMPEGESMFKYHGYSGPCPKPPLPKQPSELEQAQEMYKKEVLTHQLVTHKELEQARDRIAELELLITDTVNGELNRLRGENARIKEALIGLRLFVNPDCWCMEHFETDGKEPHSKVCIDARQALAQAKEPGT